MFLIHKTLRKTMPFPPSIYFVFCTLKIVAEKMETPSMEGGSLTMLTAGEFVVTEILSWDASADAVYFMGTSSEGPGARHLYSVTTSRGASTTLSCLTCEIRVRAMQSILFFQWLKGQGHEI